MQTKTIENEENGRRKLPIINSLLTESNWYTKVDRQAQGVYDDARLN
ncbi:MAG: hypothetical protein ACI8RD_002679 [Bacillariaceae sp.]|jgi:hypothetical protein